MLLNYQKAFLWSKMKLYRTTPVQCDTSWMQMCRNSRTGRGGRGNFPHSFPDLTTCKVLWWRNLKAKFYQIHFLIWAQLMRKTTSATWNILKTFSKMYGNTWTSDWKQLLKGTWDIMKLYRIARNFNFWALCCNKSIVILYCFLFDKTIEICQGHLRHPVQEVWADERKER